MKIGDVNIPPVTPTRTGMYLARAKDGKYTGIGLLFEENGQKMLRFVNDMRIGLAEDFLCFGPMMFTELPDKIHTTFRVEPNWQQGGTPGRT